MKQVPNTIEMCFERLEVDLYAGAQWSHQASHGFRHPVQRFGPSVIVFPGFFVLIEVSVTRISTIFNSFVPFVNRFNTTFIVF